MSIEARHRPSQPTPPRRRGLVVALLALLALLAASCASNDDQDGSPDPPSSGETPDAGDLGRGVTDDTISIGYTYLNIDDLRDQGIVDVNHGPQDEHIQVLVDDLNANGGINGRQVEVTAVPFTPTDPESQQNGCLELTEDQSVFAVLGSLQGDNVLCYTEQHDTVAVLSENMTQERLDRSTAPYTTASATDETLIEDFITTAAEDGLFDGLTVAVHSTDSAQVARDIAIPAFEKAGIDVAFESLIEADGTVGGAAAAVSVNVEAMRSRGVDAVYVVGDSIVAANTFISEDFLPTMFIDRQGSAQGLAVRADLTVFPALYTHGGFTDVYRFEEPTFQDECVPVWDAARPDDPVVSPNDVADGEPSHVVGLGNACRALKLFSLAAEAAGPTLNNATFQTALDQMDEFDLPGYGPASLGPDKYGAQDDLRFWIYDPDTAESDSGFAPYDG